MGSSKNPFFGYFFTEVEEKYEPFKSLHRKTSLVNTALA
jgi:hypothetical protein